MTGIIPHSPALAEADSDSLSALMSEDPEGAKFKAGLPRIVEALRAQRVRWAASEGEKKVRQPRVAGATATSVLKQIPQSADDLGF